MEKITKLSGEKRTTTGKKFNRLTRREGKIPAVLYGIDQENLLLSLSYTDIEDILKSEFGTNTILEIALGDRKYHGIIREIQYDYLGDHIIHVDLLKLNLKKKVTVSIPIIIKGEPVGVKMEDGVFDFINRNIEVRCLPQDIIRNIEVDVSHLHSGQSIKAGSLELSDKLELLSDEDRVICAVTGREEEEVVEEEVAEEEGAEAEGESAEESKEETGEKVSKEEEEKK